MLKPFNDDQRLQALRSYCALESGANDALDRLTRLASSLFQVPIAVVSLVDAEQQVFKSRHGLDSGSTPREHAFCSHTILRREALIVRDATLDPRFADNPLVTGEPGVRFYAGFPLITSIGFRLGAFCLIDTVARDDFDAAKCVLLEDLATLAMLALESDRQNAAPSELDVESAAAAEAQYAAMTAVAHDMRAPLATIVSLANVIQSEAFGPVGDGRYQGYSAEIVCIGSFLVDLSRKVLDAARLRTGEIEISEDELRPAELFGASSGLVSDQAAQHGVQISAQPGPARIGLRADRTLVLQMIINLLSNAIKFSRVQGDILLEAHCRQDGGIDLTVLDQGIGMSSDEIAYALKPFCQLPGQSNQDDGGIGLGLPLVRQLVEAHGGQLLIESKKGVGTAATLRFPSFRVIPDLP